MISCTLNNFQINIPLSRLVFLQVVRVHVAVVVVNSNVSPLHWMLFFLCDPCTMSYRMFHKYSSSPFGLYHAKWFSENIFIISFNEKIIGNKIYIEEKLHATKFAWTKYKIKHVFAKRYMRKNALPDTNRVADLRNSMYCWTTISK